ncbi:hypothetical protein IFM89_003131 [Coptis chinensis]|uniref:F-box associated beta-propeller type 3 domain-containing protein n=1 Tax=Coptis chinensis TaxID=261450 RepID=A0A835M6M9_9MAGN|nr:hypothetical protein IFM89_003131 [Coptis chinensis]
MCSPKLSKAVAVEDYCPLFNSSPAETSVILGSCHGIFLIGIYNPSRKPRDLHADSSVFMELYLWNPSTKEYRTLPAETLTKFSKDQKRYYYEDVYGFGYDPTNDDYKVIRIVCNYDITSKGYKTNCHVSEVHLYSLRANTCRMIDIPYFIHSPFQHKNNLVLGTFFNGAIHWFGNHILATTDEFPWRIVSFDIAKEECKEIPQPDFDKSSLASIDLGVLEGCFCMYLNYYHFSSDYLDIIMMKS